MTELALVLAGLAIIGLVVLAFGYASLLSILRDLQDAVMDGDVGARPTRRIEAFADDQVSIVLVTESGCISCYERVQDLSQLVDESVNGVASLSFYLLHVGKPIETTPLPERIKVIDDPDLTGSLGIGVMPSVVVFDGSGQERARTIVGDRQSFDQIVLWAKDIQPRESV